MPKPKKPKKPPSYLLHKPSGQARVRINGRDVYLGVYDSEESHEAYRRIVARWLATKGNLATAATTRGRSTGRYSRRADDDLTIAEVMARYWLHAEEYYRKEGEPTDTLANLKAATRRFNSLFGNSIAAEFGPLDLKTFRNAMMQEKDKQKRPRLCRKTINYYASLIKGMFKWAVEEELVPPSVYEGLRAVSGLRMGRSEARETDPVRPVADQVVEQTCRFLSPVVADMVRIQRLTSMRPQDLCKLAAAHIDMSGKVWLYEVPGHKTLHHGHKRIVAIGPKAQAILTKYLKRDIAAPLFSPREAEAARLAEKHARRETPLHRGNRPGTNRKRVPKRQPGDCYTPDSYRRAITRACDEGYPPPSPLAQREDETEKEWLARLSPKELKELEEWRKAHRWHPHQLRHSAATQIRKEFGLDAAGAALGHRSLDVTQIYAERNLAQAQQVALAIG
jgi:integrase